MRNYKNGWIPISDWSILYVHTEFFWWIIKYLCIFSISFKYMCYYLIVCYLYFHLSNRIFIWTKYFALQSIDKVLDTYFGLSQNWDPLAVKLLPVDHLAARICGYKSHSINSLWPNDGTWRHRSGINTGLGNGLVPTIVDLSPERSCGIYMIALSSEDPKTPISKTYWKLHL